MFKDLVHNITRSNGLAPATRTADANAASVNRTGYEAVGIIAHLGNSADTLSASVKVELEVEVSDDNSVWTDCPDVDLIGAITGTNTGTFAVVDDPAEDDQLYAGSYIGIKKFVRCVLNLTGTHTNGMPSSVHYELASPRRGL